MNYISPGHIVHHMLLPKLKPRSQPVKARNCRWKRQTCSTWLKTYYPPSSFARICFQRRAPYCTTTTSACAVWSSSTSSTYILHSICTAQEPSKPINFEIPMKRFHRHRKHFLRRNARSTKENTYNFSWVSLCPIFISRFRTTMKPHQSPYMSTARSLWSAEISSTSNEWNTTKWPKPNSGRLTKHPSCRSKLRHLPQPLSLSLLLSSQKERDHTPVQLN